jgi:drug/metabolite transporter (DMT)-like permease
MALGWVVAVIAAIGAAACFGSSGVFEHRATHSTRTRSPLSPGLLGDLIRLRGFRLGVILGAAGFGLQVLALRFGPLILVQPLLVTGVLFYLAVASVVEHRRIDKTMVAGVLLALAGLSGFLVTARPETGHGSFTSAAALPLGCGLVAVVALCLFVTGRVQEEFRALPLAAATAVFYGVTAGLVRSLTSGATSGDLLGRWELYAVIVIGPAGFLLNQNAYQRGKLGSVALTTITVGDPIVAIGIGLAWLGESIAGGWSTLGEILALAVMVAGIALLAHRAQRVAEELQDAAGERADAAERSERS